jgi:hypothetical protein
MFAARTRNASACAPHIPLSNFSEGHLPIMQYPPTPRRAHARAMLFSVALILVSTNCASPQTKPQQTSSQPTATHAQTPATAPPKSAQDRTPSDTVRAFYTALRERRVRDAFQMSIYKPAIDALTPEEFEELRPEFEKLGEAVPPQIGIYGEQISGERATVFALISTEPGAKQEPVDLIRVGGEWIVGSSESYETVRREGKEFFVNARINTHHAELRKVLLKLVNAEAIYAAQNGGRYADLTALTQSETSMRLGLGEDISALTTLGYRLTLVVAADGKSYKLNAEPVRYGRTGRLSFYTDAAGMQEKDNGGKPFNPPGAKKKN